MSAPHVAFSHCYPPLIYYLTKWSLSKNATHGKILKKVPVLLYLMLCSILYCIYFLKLSKEERKALELISTIGCSVSLIGVILTILIYALFWKRLHRNSKSKVPSQVLIHLCVVIGMTDIFAILAGPALKYKVKLRENRKRTGLILSEGGGALESFVEYCNEIT